MKKTILAYILSCIEEIEDDKELGSLIRNLQDVIFKELQKKEDSVLNVIFVYINIFNNQDLGFQTRDLYNEIKYFFDGCTTDTQPNSH